MPLPDLSSKEPVVVALSGGVDSAAAAAKLVAAGYRVVGITMRLFDASGTAVSSGGRCCGPRDIEDARRICAHLDIPFYVVDFEADFQAAVVDDFIDAYLAGETPNPCVKCNQHIKFTPLLRRARAMGASVVVTGHYARIETTDAGRLRLRRGVDPSKDQSYFLFSMPPDELGSVAFPLGGLTKDQVRDLARSYGLPNAEKAESQEICFVPDGRYADFVAKHALRRGKTEPAPGEMVDVDGAVVGSHRGIHHYTIGQRRGLGNVLGPEPAYVVAIDASANRVVVGPRESVGHAAIEIRDLRWFEELPDQGDVVLVQVRHRAKPIHARVSYRGDRVVAAFVDGPIVAAPGQAAVLYHDDIVIGGGWIATPQ